MVAFDKCVWTADAKDIEVWTARPQALDAHTVAGLQLWLDSSECARAACFRSPADQRSYVVAHALQRWLLARAMDCTPAAIRLATGPAGKPVLLNGAPPERPFFNLSHTREAVACAISRHRPVGVDLESFGSPGGVDGSLLEPFITRVPDHLQGARDEAARTRQLFLLWTAFEAYWKSQGTGLGSARPRLAVRAARDAALEIRHEGDAATDAPRARVRSSDAVPGHVLSVAVPCACLN